MKNKVVVFILLIIVILGFAINITLSELSRKKCEKILYNLDFSAVEKITVSNNDTEAIIEGLEDKLKLQKLINEIIVNEENFSRSERELRKSYIIFFEQNSNSVEIDIEIPRRNSYIMTSIMVNKDYYSYCFVIERDFCEYVEKTLKSFLNKN